MEFGPGRPAKKFEVLSVREVSQGEVDGFERTKSVMLQRFRDSHHMVARCFALGLRTWQVAQKMGYSETRVSMLYADPAFQELIAGYRDKVDKAFVEGACSRMGLYDELHTKTLRAQLDQIDEAEELGEKVPLRTLNVISADAADRLGYSKKTVSLNVNLDLAARLDRAIERSGLAPKQIEGELASPSELQANQPPGGAWNGEGKGLAPLPSPTSLKRRA